jgi:hypothetical protein
MLLRDATEGQIRSTKDVSSRVLAKCDYHCGLNDAYLPVQVRSTRLDFVWQRITIFWWSAFHNVSNEHLCSRKADLRQQRVQKLSGCSNKRLPLDVF